VNEVLGPLNQVYFSVKPEKGMKQQSKIYVNPMRLKELKFFMAPEKPNPLLPKVKKEGGASSGRGGGRGRGGSRGGGMRGGGSRGGFSGRGSGAPSRGGFSRGRGRGSF
jgi:H/ACA ribonucleoprotein complex subunit 1